MPKQRQFKRTKVDLTELLRGQEEELSKLEFALLEAQGLERESIKQQRLTAIAQAEAAMAVQKYQAAYTKFMLLAAEHSNTVAEEPVWMKPYRNAEGHIMLETIFTQKDQRMAFRVAHKQLQNQANSDEFQDLFEEEEPEDGDDR